MKVPTCNSSNTAVTLVDFNTNYISELSAAQITGRNDDGQKVGLPDGKLLELENAHQNRPFCLLDIDKISNVRKHLKM